MADSQFTNGVDNPINQANIRIDSSTITSAAVDQVTRLSPSGPTNTVIGDNFRGFNHRQAPSLIQINKDYFGMAFFTRPRLNLTTDNLRTIRKFAPLLTTNQSSYQSIIRCYLDPIGNKNGSFASPFVDPNQAFIPILSNMLDSLTGWPDIAMPYSTSHEGVMKEQFNLADGTNKIYRSVELTANFRNLPNDPITALFDYWLEYMNGVYLGEIIPYGDMIYSNRVDYYTRIYRFVLDSTKRYIYRIGATGYGMPVSSPMGAAFNYEQKSGPINLSLQEVSVHFINSGVTYNDDILCYEFNKTVQMFNPGMKDAARASAYKKVSLEELQLFNYKGYPNINLNTYELEWWVSQSDYNQTLPVINLQQTILGQ